MTKYQPKVSIIIPVRKVNDYIKESISYILNLNYKNFEILVFPDVESKESFQKTRIIPTGKIGPAQKRDLALKYADGEILAFLDDDAYPKKDWLGHGVRHFENPNMAAVGGPAVTPENNSFWQKVSGAVFLSKLSGANPERYWPVGKVREIDDWPSVNLLVRKSDFSAVSGFNSEYWPGEDTKLCLDLIKKLNKKIIYDPEVFVWHHRRSGLIKHLKQIGNYGIHRGFFAKKYPETSFKLKYLTPSFFFIFILIGWSLLFLPSPFRLTYFGVWLLYILTLFISVFSIYNKIKVLKISLATTPYIFLTHIYYGWRFIQGFVFTKNLKR
ncbi:MAG: glycosyl transferase [Candidatus Nealsonbacteria bacterium CG08_land_8_20_14_0_20_38_20]|uniref:Glycosyl transferase n=1 Tax=Candidatus Nealsonbacteria bacterium CG08_land_8_20_14_0_20_38_20 TaxID=1974705 RepID=A0A2H0YKZ5_9BACT|nr:MAG: glycosyl transferase [Candidatus Nealsonbacteria bacterium CG08_land_8_20_14_0_20_38_20]